MSEKDNDNEFEDEKTQSFKNTFNIYGENQEREISSISEEIKKRQKLRQMRYKKNKKKKTIKLLVVFFLILLCGGFSAYLFLSAKTLKRDRKSVV